MVRILYHGVLREVVVDDYIPVTPQNTPLFAKPAGGREIWVMILEKAWAKLHGSYGAIVGNNLMIQVVFLTKFFMHSQALRQNIVQCQQTKLNKRNFGKIFSKLIKMVRSYVAEPREMQQLKKQDLSLAMLIQS